MTHELTTDDTAAMRSRPGEWRAYLRSEMDRGRYRAANPQQQPQTGSPATAADIRCPHCSAPPGRPCTTRSGRHAVAVTHDARHAAYATARRNSQEQPA